MIKGVIGAQSGRGSFETYSECGGAVKVAVPAHLCTHGISASMHVIASIEDPVVIKKILAHLKEKVTLAGLGRLPECRAPPQIGWLEEAHHSNDRLQ